VQFVREEEKSQHFNNAHLLATFVPRGFVYLDRPIKRSQTTICLSSNSTKLTVIFSRPRGPWWR